ncbi:MAG TPA: ATP-binding protein [Solirubrobacteraceae bacterium]|nr:ATP-binding protein [Solirubrobacteraceae bacterium]
MTAPGARRRLTVRTRVSLIFAIVLATVLGGTGVFVDLRVRAEMNHAIDQSLRSRAGLVVALVREADSGLRQAGRTTLNNRARGFAQVLDARGATFDFSPEAGRQPVLTPAEVAGVRTTGEFSTRTAVAGLPGDVRLLAIPVRAQGQNLVVVVGSTLAEREAALTSLRTLLIIGGLGALVLSALAGYLAVAGALRPIELMRQRAEAITAAEPGSRLPVPPTDDEVARLGGTLNSMLDRLEGALRHERTFVMDASHELRSPLAILKTELELALRGPQSTEALEQTIRSASQETDRLTQLAEDLLTIARGEQGQLVVTKSPLDTGELLEGLRDRFASRALDAGRSIVVSDSVRVTVSADRARLEQALANLIENALRYGEGEITLWTHVTDASVELHVSDRGRGFDPRFLPDAFRRFSRHESGRSTEGTGLGLAIVVTIASAHHGSAHAANRDDGADVWLALPAGQEAA